MSKYYLWNMVKKQSAEITSVTTGSQSFSADSTSFQGRTEQHCTDISPDGKYVVRLSRRYSTGGSYDEPYLQIHQSSSDFAGGFHFGNGPSGSGTEVFNSQLEYTAQPHLIYPYARWISNNEVAVTVASNSGKLADGHNLVGAGFPSGEVTTDGQSSLFGLFFILSGSGTEWEVTFFATGSKNTRGNSDGDTSPGSFLYGDFLAFNHEHTTHETDRIVVLESGVQSQSNRASYATVFAKTGGNWGWHSTFQWDDGAHLAHNAVWFDDDQDHLAIHGQRSNSSMIAMFSPEVDGSNDTIKYKTMGDWENAASYPPNALAWDPYNKRFYVGIPTKDAIFQFNSSSNWVENRLTKTFWDMRDDNSSERASEEIYVHDNFGSAYVLEGSYNNRFVFWRFRSGSAAFMWPSSGGKGNKALYFMESGSYGWLGANRATSYIQWGMRNRDATGWQHGGDSRVFHQGNQSAYNDSKQLSVLGGTSQSPVTPWIWATAKGASGDLFYWNEAASSDSNNIGTGRNVFANLNTYANTPDEYTPLTAHRSGSTSYQVSSSIESGLTFEFVPDPHLNDFDYPSYGHYGGKFSPDGLKVAVPAQRGYGNSGGVQPGVNVFKSGSTGWAIEAFLSSSHGTYEPSSVDWASDGELWGVGMGTAPIRWTSSSAGGWDSDDETLYGTLVERNYQADNHISKYTRIRFNRDRTAAVLFKDQANSNINHSSNIAIFAILMSSSQTGGKWDMNAYLDSGKKSYHSFAWAGDGPQGDLRLLAFDNERATMLNVISSGTTQGLIRSFQFSDSYDVATQRMDELGTDDAFIGGMANGFHYWHSSSDSLIYAGRPSTNAQSKLYTAKLNPFGKELGIGSNALASSGTLMNPAVMNPVYKIGHNNQEYLGAQSLRKFANGDYLMGSGSSAEDFIGGYSNYALDTRLLEFPSMYIPLVQDRYNDDRFFVGHHRESNALPAGFTVFERGVDGWKMKRIPVEYNWTTMAERAADLDYAFDVSVNGDLLVPSTGSGQQTMPGFLIARMSGMSAPPANPSLDDSVSETVGTSGGTVSAGGTEAAPAASVVIPENALGGNVTVSVSTDGNRDPAGNGIGLAGRVAAVAYSPLVEITPHEHELSTAATLTFKLDGSVAGTCPSDLVIMKRNHETDVWYPLPSSLWSCNAGTITITTTRFSQYQAIGGTEMARTKINNNTIATLTQANLVSGSAITFTGSAAGSISDSSVFLIQNTGDVPKSITAESMATYFAGEITVSSSESQNENFRLTFVDPTADTAGLAVDGDTNKLVWNPSSDTLTVGGAVAGATTVSGSGAFTAGTLVAGHESQFTVSSLGLVSSSATSTLHNATLDQITVGSADINGGAIDGATIGASSQSSVKATTLSGSSTLNVEGIASFGPGAKTVIATDGGLTIAHFDANWTNAGITVADLGVVTTVDINGGSIDGATIGAASQSSVKATTLSGSSTLNVAGVATFGAGEELTISAASVLSGSATATLHNATLDQITVGSADINGGAIDGATIGASSQSSVKATTLSGSSTLDVAGASRFGAGNQLTISAVGLLSGSATATLHNATLDQITVGSVDINGGAVDGATIGASSQSSVKATTLSGSSTLNVEGIASFGPGAKTVIATDGGLTIAHFDANWTNAGITVADLGTVTTVDINGGSIDGATIGAASQSSVKATTLSGSGLVTAVGGASFGGEGQTTISATGVVSGSGTSTLHQLEADRIAVEVLDVNTINSNTITQNTLEIEDFNILAGLSGSSNQLDGGGFLIGGKQGAALGSLVWNDGETGLRLNVGATTYAKVNSSGVQVTGIVSGSGVLTVPGVTVGTAVLDEADLEQLDGITAGTVAASKAVVVDSDKDINGFRSITASANVYADKFFGDGAGLTNVGATIEAAGDAVETLQLVFASGTTSVGTSAGLFIDSGSLRYNINTNALLAPIFSGSGDSTVHKVTMNQLVAGTADINGGAIDGATIGATSPSSIEATTISGSGTADFAGQVRFGTENQLTVSTVGLLSGSATATLHNATLDQVTVGSADINGGAIDGATIGATSQSSIKATSISGSGTADFAGQVRFGRENQLTVSQVGLLSGSATATLHNATLDQITVGSADINGGAIDGATIGASSQSSVKATTLSGSSTLNVAGVATFGAGEELTISAASVLSGSATATLHNATLDQVTVGSADINGGAIDGTTIGATSQSSVKATTLSGSGVVTGAGGASFGGAGQTTISATGVVSGSGDSTLHKVTLNQLVAATADINGGTIDAANITVGSGKTLDVSGGTLTLANDQISGDKINGGTIGSVTITQLAGAMDANSQAITNINVDSGAIDGTAIGANSQSTVEATTVSGSGLVTGVGGASFGGEGQTTIGTTGIISGSGTSTLQGITVDRLNVATAAGATSFMSASAGDGLIASAGVLKIESVEQVLFSGSSNMSLNAVTASLTATPVDNSIQVFLNGILQTNSGSLPATNPGVFDYKIQTHGQTKRVILEAALDSDDILTLAYIKKFSNS